MPPRAKLPPAEKRRIQAIFDELARDRPDPKTELDYFPARPFTLVVAVALSAQATDKSVNKATEALFKVADTPQKMVELGEDGLIPYIRTIGLYRTKARNVIRMSHILIDQYGGEVPLEREALQSLPGVGRKTASVVLNELGVEPAIAVDTHVFRVSHRLKLAKGKTPDQVEQELMAKVPVEYLKTAHHLLILHGRYVCVARKPKCLECPVAQWCPSRDLFV
jgi:endonuclease-3